jgi:flagellin FlaB
MRKFVHDEAFTGLEAAIVLIAFVVVAAVFSYVVLGAGFFTTQKSQEVVHSGVAQASSSLELSGNIVGQSDAAGAELDKVIYNLQLTAGGGSVDMSAVTFTVSEKGIAPVTITWTDASLSKTWKNAEATADNLLESGELLQLTMTVTAYNLNPNDKFVIEIKPSIGAPLSIERTVPAGLTASEYYQLY